ncbi:hypothetical protein BREVUG8_110261 [Brevundimonas sp. G8]|nr:hypothetical protein BREVUG8_110261 [Brevundimonas sp. G8]
MLFNLAKKCGQKTDIFNFRFELGSDLQPLVAPRISSTRVSDGLGSSLQCIPSKIPSAINCWKLFSLKLGEFWCYFSTT